MQLLQQEIIDETDQYVDNMQVRSTTSSTSRSKHVWQVSFWPASYTHLHSRHIFVTPAVHSKG